MFCDASNYHRDLESLSDNFHVKDGYWDLKSYATRMKFIQPIPESLDLRCNRKVQSAAGKTDRQADAEENVYVVHQRSVSLRRSGLPTWKYQFLWD